MLSIALADSPHAHRWLLSALDAAEQVSLALEQPYITALVDVPPAAVR